MLFSEIIGQQDIKNRLIKSVHENRIAHAQLFFGQEGLGKLQLAIAYAQYIACQNKGDHDSCGTCPNCVKYAKLQHPDLHFVFPVVKPTGARAVVCDDFIFEFREIILNKKYFSEQEWYAHIGAEAKSGMIYANESSEIINKLNIKSYESGYKVMIIWLPEKMNITCANKILKLLEEPQGQTIFIMVSNTPETIISTILSRTQQIRIPQLQQHEIAEAMVKSYSLNENEAQYFARIANGSYGKAVAQLNENSDKQNHFRRFTELMRMAWLVGHKRDYVALMNLNKWAEEMASSKLGREQQKSFFIYAQHITRENFIFNLQNSSLNYLDTEEEGFSRNFARFVNERNVEDMMTEFLTAQQQIEQNGNAKIIFFDVALRMIMMLKR